MESPSVEASWNICICERIFMELLYKEDASPDVIGYQIKSPAPDLMLGIY